MIVADLPVFPSHAVLCALSPLQHYDDDDWETREAERKRQAEQQQQQQQAMVGKRGYPLLADPPTPVAVSSCPAAFMALLYKSSLPGPGCQAHIAAGQVSCPS